jgi:hypothetical protein
MIGQFSSEKKVGENLRARQIVDEILRFGVNDRIIKMIIVSLAMNLESNDEMKNIVNLIRSLDSDLFLIDNVEEIDHSENTGETNGKIIT